MTSQRTTQGARPTFRRGGRRRRQCFCKESKVDYKDVSNIRRFITDRGRIEAGKKSGNCAKCQRTLTIAIKRARHLALLPYAPHHLRVTGEVAVNAKITEDDEVVSGGSEESNETAESTDQTQGDLGSPVMDTEPESEIEIPLEVPAVVTETKLDEEDQEDSNHVESESQETPNVESPDSEENK
ncbi:MAG: 30S ribosomal protein S18 [Chloroflexota bacterium]|nr:30S ribosomal protein S18 [Chloroflexota bacterium]MQG37400.1 30S ribosomal protein S18 [SAR202 cluster bacterium]